MRTTHIPFQKTGFFSKIITDYIAQETKIRPFYHHFPNLEGFYKQIQEKQASFRLQSRLVLVQQLTQQYKGVKISKKTEENIHLLKKENTFTITTGHQLNVFTGPLYFLYKLFSTINLCEELTAKFPEQNFVPIYWMATEDHDFEEINHFNFQGKKVQWNRQKSGAVGRFSTEGLEVVFNEFSKHLGSTKNATYLKKIFSEAYLSHKKLADATQFIVNELFGKYGLVIIDADNKELKREFAPIMEGELRHQKAYKNVSNTASRLKKEYKVQVNPRDINLFYLTDNLRERIILEDDHTYSVNNTTIRWTLSEIQKHLYQEPEKFSPNVIMRPVYQELILPNICYIGGGGEIAYWLELKAYFEELKISFPILLLRNSVQVVSKKQQKKLQQLKIPVKDIFLPQKDLLSQKTKENSKIAIDFSSQKKLLQNQFILLKEIARETDKSFIGAVNAQEKKQLNGLENLEKRLLKAEMRRQKSMVDSIIKLQDELLPNHQLEERQRNFSEYYLEFGASFLEILKLSLKPLQLEFTIIEEI